MYFLRSIIGQVISGTIGGFCSGWSFVRCYHDRNSNFLLWEVHDRVGLALVSYSKLVLDGIEDLIDEKPQWGEVLFLSEGFEWIRERIENTCFLKAG